MKAFSNGILLTLVLFVAAPALAADLININTADSATLQTLNGIGPSKAQAIIDYRTQHGPFAAIEDIMNVSGIGTATFNNIKDFITVGTPSSQTQTQTETQTQSQQSQTSPPLGTGGNAIPALSVRITADSKSVAGGGELFKGEAYGAQDLPLQNARYLWNFGDGATAEGQEVFHIYAYPGTYVLILTAASGIQSGSSRMSVTVTAPSVRLTAESDGSLTVSNASQEELAVGYWMLVRGSGAFMIPDGTIIGAGGAVRFAPSLLKLPTGEAQLRFPDGSVAAYEKMSAHAEGITYLSASEVRSAPAPAVRSAPASVATSVARSQEQAPLETVPVSNLAAATADSNIPVPLWGSVLGLAALIALGVAATLYARLPARVPPAPAAALSARGETAAQAGEFEIIDATPVEEGDPSR